MSDESDVIDRTLARRAADAAPHSSPLARQAQRIIFAANDSFTAARAPIGWTVALSADPAYAQWAHPFVVETLRRNGLRVVSWCDCDATPAQAAIAMAESLGLDGWIGQAENSRELRNAYDARAQVIIGNPNEWTQDEREWITGHIERNAVAIIGEMYRPDPNYSAQGVPIASYCYGIALDAGSYTPLSDYLAVSPPGSVETCCVYHAAGLRDEDWRLLS